MLVQLAISDIVLIEKANVPFAEGLCVLSGETGAGKSILLDALGLALGQRAEARLVRAGQEKGSVTAEFEIANAPHLHATLDELGLELEDERLIIRRQLTADGKSRCFVNDQPVSVAGLRALGEQLVEIHGQHDQRGLLDPASHRDLLDGFAGLDAQRRTVEAAYKDWQTARAELKRLEDAVARARAEEEYVRHTLQELDVLDPQPDEEDALAEKRQFMMNSEKRMEAIHAASAELEGDRPVVDALQAAMRMLGRSAAVDAERCEAIVEQLEKATDAVNDAHFALQQLASDSQFDQHELERVEERLFALRGLARKHQISVAELPQKLAELREKVAMLEDQSGALKGAKEAVQSTRDAYVKVAETLTAKRQTAAKKLDKAIMEELAGLKMKGTQVLVECEPLPEDQWQAGGMERVAFLASTNPGNPPAPLVKIASGGELSRFMLALKVAMRAVRSTPTLIFDEIDTGTGGAVADAIGKRLAQLGEGAQVLVVTHLPQVAAYGAHHLRISKQADANVTRTQVEHLSGDARREELARMLAGANITDEARAAADKLMAIG